MAPNAKLKAVAGSKGAPAGAGAAAAAHLKAGASAAAADAGLHAAELKAVEPKAVEPTSAEPKAKAQTAQAKAGPKAKAEAKAEPEPKSKAAAKVEPKAKAEPKGKPGAKPAAKAKQGSIPQDAANLKVEEEAKAEEEKAKAIAETEMREKEHLERKRKEETEAELERIQALANGEVTIKYNMYAEKFLIEGHTLTAATIDELYCLSDVMPGCFIHLGDHEFAYAEEHSYVKEDPVGTFKGLMAGETYWCYVQQDLEQEKHDLEQMRKQFAGGVATGIGDRGEEGEHCSCGDGAPCGDSAICKDWNNRFANALKAGGNPILFS